MPKTLHQWLVTTLTLIIVALGTWTLKSVPELRERSAVAETRIDGLTTQFNKIDSKLDKILDEQDRVKAELRLRIPIPLTPSVIRPRGVQAP